MSIAMDSEVNQTHPVIYSAPMLDLKIANLIADFCLTKETNVFFNRSKKIDSLSLLSAIKIAFHWREMTKQFMFTTLIGMGTLAEQISRLSSPPEHVMQVLQTGIAVISDDLNNISTAFEVAPKGAAGVHYTWWENSILNPLLLAAQNNQTPYELVVSPKIQKLLECMTKLSKNPLGSALQLRVVEDIALHIAVAYRALFLMVEVDGKKIFPERDDLVWINSHIKAEVVHHRQVTDQDYGMMHIAKTAEEQEELLILAKEYIQCWALALDEFNTFF